MISIRQKVSQNALAANLVEHAKKDRSIKSSGVFKTIVTASLISVFSNPIFAETVSAAALAEHAKPAAVTVSSEVSSLPLALFKDLNSSSNVKVMSFSGKNTSGGGDIKSGLLDSRFPLSEVYAGIRENYANSIEQMNDRELVGNYKSWLKIRMSMLELILSAKDGLPKQSMDDRQKDLDELKYRLDAVEKTDFDNDKIAMPEFRRFVLNEGEKSLPSEDAVEQYKDGFAYAMSLYGTCSVLYNHDAFPDIYASSMSKIDNSAVYGTSADLISAYFVNHELSHCESQQSRFLMANNELASKEIGKLKNHKQYSSLDKEQSLMFSILSINYSEYMSEFYADLLGISKTIKSNNMSSGEAQMLVNDVINMRNTLGINGDVIHATGSLLEKAKQYYDKKGMLFGSDLGGGDTDEKVSEMVNAFGGNNFLDAMRMFTVVASIRGETNIDFKTAKSYRSEVRDKVDYKAISKVLSVSQNDINNYTKNLRFALNSFSTDGDGSNIIRLVKDEEKSLKKALLEKESLLSFDY